MATHIARTRPAQGKSTKRLKMASWVKEMKSAPGFRNALLVAVLVGGFTPASVWAQQAADASMSWPREAGSAAAVTLGEVCDSVSQRVAVRTSPSSNLWANSCDWSAGREQFVSIPVLRSSGNYIAQGAVIGALLGGLVAAAVFHARYVEPDDAPAELALGYSLYFALGILPGAIVGLTVGSKIPR